MATIISAKTSGVGGLEVTGDATGILQLASNNGTTAVTVDASQNVGIGTSSPSGSSKLHVVGDIRLARSTTASDAALYFGSNDTNYLYSGNGSNIMAFATNNAERMRIDSSGNVGIGTTSPASMLDVNGELRATSTRATGSGQDAAWFTSSGVVVTMTFGDIGAGGKGIFQYNRSAGSILVRSSSTGGVTLAGGATSWASASDENIKDIIEPIENGLEKVLTLRTVIGKYKDDQEGTRRSFLIAQDVQKVLPESISIINKGEDNEYLGLAYTDTIPLLVAAIKEQQAIINDLKARIETLEGASA